MVSVHAILCQLPGSSTD